VVLFHGPCLLLCSTSTNEYMVKLGIIQKKNNLQKANALSFFTLAFLKLTPFQPIALYSVSHPLKLTYVLMYVTLGIDFDLLYLSETQIRSCPYTLM